MKMMNLEEGCRKCNRRRQIEREDGGQRRPDVARREMKERVGVARRGPGVRRRIEGDEILEEHPKHGGGPTGSLRDSVNRGGGGGGLEGPQVAAAKVHGAERDHGDEGPNVSMEGRWW